MHCSFLRCRHLWALGLACVLQLCPGCFEKLECVTVGGKVLLSLLFKIISAA